MKARASSSAPWLSDVLLGRESGRTRLLSPLLSNWRLNIGSNITTQDMELGSHHFSHSVNAKKFLWAESFL